MDNRSKLKADGLIKISGWLFIIQSALVAITLILKLTVIPIDSLESDDFSTFEPLVIVGLFFLGRGILKRKEWIRGLAVWILGIRLIVGLPLSLLLEMNYPIWSIIIDAIINICLIAILIQPNVKKQFTEKMANQNMEPTVKTPID